MLAHSITKEKIELLLFTFVVCFPLEMVKGKGKSARQTRNLLLKMSSDQLDGPLNVLKEWKVQRKRVKVRERAFVRATTSNDMFCILTISQYLSGTFIYLHSPNACIPCILLLLLQIFTRNVTTINGHATGFIEAFDKHWNIVLSDVVEVWKRKKFHYCPKAVMLHDNNEDEQLAECIQRLRVLNITMPTVAVKSLNRKLVECTRNVPKLLIRGEQIATIILDSQTIKPETEITFQPL